MVKGTKILIVEDDERVRAALSSLLQGWGYDCYTASDGRQGWEMVVSSAPAVVLCDLLLPGLNGLELLERTRASNPGILFIMLSGHGTIQNAVEATKLGAYNFLEKPIDPGRLRIELKNCLDRHDSERRLEIAHRKLRDLGVLGRLVGRSRKMQEVMSVITMAAPTSASVLITGESGTGKEVIARTIHELSPCRENPFVVVNCAAIPETLLESELFGHEKGAFTGATNARAGCFELAQGGTLLLDEIGEMPVAAQAKLLRVLEDSKVRRLSAQSEIPITVRVLAATNRNPEAAIQSGQLRKDLYYRINVIRIAIPPLRDRMEDLEELTSVLLEDLNRKHDRSVQAVDPGSLDLMRRYRWPGNVRELRNTLERAVVICHGGIIKSRDLPPQLHGQVETGGSEDQLRISAGITIDEVERRLILATLASTNQNKSKAAAMLGITLKTLQAKLRKYAGLPTTMRETADKIQHDSNANPSI